MKLTGRYREVFCYVADYIAAKGVSPTYKEIQEYMGYKSISSAYYIIKQLELYGYLYKIEDKERMLRVCKRFSNS